MNVMQVTVLNRNSTKEEDENDLRVAFGKSARVEAFLFRARMRGAIKDRGVRVPASLRLPVEVSDDSG